MKTNYKKSGVNIELGDMASKILYQAAKKTWENRKGTIGEVITPFDDFSGLRMVDIGALPKGSFICLGFDGVGTKVEIAERMSKHDTMAFDLFAMVCDDAVIRGGEPVLLGSVLDVKSLGEGRNSNVDFIKALARGYVKAAKEAKVAVINGELAELGARISGFGSFNYNWGAGLVWFANKDRLITGKKVKVGDSIVALQERGFRSNGLSLARRILEDNYGANWHTKDFNGENLAENVLVPSKIYSRVICDMTGGFSNKIKVNIHALAHVTGGGVPGKLGRALRPSGFGAQLDNLFSPCKLMLHLQKIGDVEDEEAYKTWNMGQGMLIVTSEPEKVIKIAKDYHISSKVAGRIIPKKEIKIISKGFQKKNQQLIFPL